MSEEVDTIQHLLDVEHEAAEVMLAAQVQADEKIAAARALAEKQFKEEYAAIASEVEGSEKKAMEDIAAKHQEQILSYKSSLDSLEQDNKAMCGLLEKLLLEQV